MPKNSMLLFDGSTPSSEKKASMDSQKMTYANIRSCLGSAKESTLSISTSLQDAIIKIYFSHLADVIYKTGKNHIIISEYDIPAIKNAANYLRQLGIIVDVIKPLENGLITADMIREKIDPRTSLVSLSWAQPMTGVILPIHEIANVCAEYGVRLHVDTSQVLASTVIRFDDQPIDYFTFAIENIGSLILSRHNTLPQTGNLFIAESIAKHLVELDENRDEVALEKVRLGYLFQELITSHIPECKILMENVERLPGEFMITFPGIHARLLSVAFAKEGVAIDLGDSLGMDLSKILLEFGIDSKSALSTARFSISSFMSDEDVATGINIIAHTVQRLRYLSFALA